MEDNESKGGDVDERPHIDDTSLASCFPIAESGETTVAYRRKMIFYKSPIPKTKLTRALLTDNVCDERRLQLRVSKLLVERRKESARFRQRMTSFENMQQQKRKSWNRADEQGLNKLNLPQLHSGSKVLKSASLNEVYRKPQNIQIDRFTVPLLPVMVGEDEQKIVEYNKQIFITRLPNVARLNTRQRTRYDGYKGAKLLEENNAVKDKRFEKLSNSLSERKSASPPKTSSLYLSKRSLTYF